VNDAITHFAIPALPFGGVGESGYGRSHGVDGFHELTRARSVLVDRLGLGREAWWFPYTRKTQKLLRSLLLFRLKGGLKGLWAAGLHMLAGRRNS
jgi:aldehyde dehydrogenase (NAD+)